MCGTEVALLVVLAVVLASWWHSTHRDRFEGLRGGRSGRGHGGRARRGSGHGGGWRGGAWRGGRGRSAWRPAWWNRPFYGRPWSHWWGADPALANRWVAGYPGYADWCAWCDAVDPEGSTLYCAANCSYRL